MLNCWVMVADLQKECNGTLLDSLAIFSNFGFEGSGEDYYLGAFGNANRHLLKDWISIKLRKKYADVKGEIKFENGVCHFPR